MLVLLLVAPCLGHIVLSKMGRLQTDPVHTHDDLPGKLLRSIAQGLDFYDLGTTLSFQKANPHLARP